MAPTTTERPALPKTLRLTSLWTIILLGATMLAFAVGMPYTLATLALGPATIGLAIVALVYTRGVDGVTGIRVWLWVSIGIGAMAAFSGFAMLLLRGPYEQLEACLERAITPTAQRECQAQFEQAYEDLLETYGGYGVTTP